jgi:hypothetical protein
MFPGDTRYQPRSIVTAVLLITLGFACVWMSEASNARPATADTGASVVSRALAGSR